jgi:hypothetical protein
MFRFVLTLCVLLLSCTALADQSETVVQVDLRNSRALAELQQSNPAHFEKITQILSGLEAQPDRAEADWLQTNFAASEVELSRLLIKTSNPPKQTLRFRLDNVRYTMHLVRSDMKAESMPLQR